MITNKFYLFCKWHFICKACLWLLCGKECYNGWIMSIGSRRGELSRGSNYLSVYAWGTTGQAQRTVHLAIACTERTKKAGDAGFSWGRGDVCPRKGPREEITTWGRGDVSPREGPRKEITMYQSWASKRTEAPDGMLTNTLMKMGNRFQKTVPV